MSTKKVSELIGAELDYWVAKAAGHEYGMAYSSDWCHGGPIIEREQISIIRMGGPPGFWLAGFDPECDQGSQCESGWIELPAIEMWHQQSGPTSLIAAMRAYVASKLGEEVSDA